MPAAHGEQFAELNANESSALYQDLKTTPGTTLYWSLQGQTVTRFAFEAGRTATGDPTVGNFLDDIVFGTAPCVVVTKTAEPESGATVGETITYNVNLTNHGGTPAEGLILHDVVPAGASYVPGSMKVTNGPRMTSGGVGWYDAKSRRLTLPLGQGATATHGGALASTVDLPDGVTAQFQVLVERDGAGRTLAGQATATM